MKHADNIVLLASSFHACARYNHILIPWSKTPKRSMRIVQTIPHKGRDLSIGEATLPLICCGGIPTYASRLAGSPTVMDQVRRP